MNITALDISESFKNTTQEEKKFYKLTADAARAYPFTGKSTVTSLSFSFLDGAQIILACYNMDKEAKENESSLTSVLQQHDSFRIDVRSSAFVNYLKKKFNFKEQSMGMSSDYLIAIKYNATYLRIGSEIFGQRL